MPSEQDQKLTYPHYCYTKGGAYVQLDDALGFLKAIPSGEVNLFLTDPPYLISKKTGFKSCGPKGVDRLAISMDFGEWDKGESCLPAVIQEMYRCLPKGGTSIIFYDLWKITELAKMMSDAGFKQLRFIEWIKTNPVPINSKKNYLTNSREVAVCGVKGGNPTFNSSYDNGVYEFPIYHGKDRFHPTQKPTELFETLIEKHSRPGDYVVDPFLGSGTTAVACLNTNRRFAGCELDFDYFKKIAQRLDSVELAEHNVLFQK